MPGGWVATESGFVRVAAPAARVDIVALGGSVTFFLSSTGSFALSRTLPGEPNPWIRAGLWFSGLTEADSTFDFGAGPQLAKWNLRLVKQAAP